MVLLEARGLGRRKPGSSAWLLRDIDLSIEGNCRLAIVGPTGSGKTVLLRALARLDSIDTGQVLWQGRPVRGDAVPAFRQQVVYLHQRPCLFEGTVEENLRLPFTLQQYGDSRFSQQAVLDLLAQVHRSESLLDQPASELSGGEAQIVALIRVIQLRPTILLLDEPTAAVDHESTHLVEQLVSAWAGRGETGRAVVWISHDREQVRRVATRVITMREGKLHQRDE